MLNVHNLTVSFMGTDLFSGITFKLNKGDRIAQVVFEMHSHESKFERVYEIDDTSRGKAGFGSSGY